LVVKRLERQFNLPAGFTREDDCLPERTMTNPAVGGVGDGEVADITPMLAECYSLGGLGSEWRAARDDAGEHQGKGQR
jgi:aldehyde:ferredoxin oxidoreductase